MPPQPPFSQPCRDVTLWRLKPSHCGVSSPHLAPAPRPSSLVFKVFKVLKVLRDPRVTRPPRDTRPSRDPRNSRDPRPPRNPLKPLPLAGVKSSFPPKAKRLQLMLQPSVVFHRLDLGHAVDLTGKTCMLRSKHCRSISGILNASFSLPMLCFIPISQSDALLTRRKGSVSTTRLASEESSAGAARR